MELRVVHPAEHNSNSLLPNQNKAVVVLPQEREDNLSKVNDKLEAEPDQSRDDVASQTSHREEEVVSIRPQQNKRPPVWLNGFITGGELKQSLSIQPEASTLAVHPVKMARQQSIRQ